MCVSCSDEINLRLIDEDLKFGRMLVLSFLMAETFASGFRDLSATAILVAFSAYLLLFCFSILIK